MGRPASRSTQSMDRTELLAQLSRQKSARQEAIMTPEPPATAPGPPEANETRHRDWDFFFERTADIPWGVLLVLVLVGLLAFGRVKGDDVQTIRALATSAGLFGIGHGIHSG